MNLYLKKNYNYLKIVIIIYVLLLISSEYPRYYTIFPSLNVYPNNKVESEIVKRISDGRTKQDIDFFNLTDQSPVDAFLNHTRYSRTELDAMITSPSVLSMIALTKQYYNRARPYQVNKEIKYLYSETRNTPSYPAGHAFQGYFLAAKLSAEDPANTGEYNRIAEYIDRVRIIAGIHYPSDGALSKYMVDNFGSYL